MSRTGTKFEMRWYRHWPLHFKPQAIVLITCSVALSLASIVFALYDRATFLRAKTLDLTTSARTIGSNSTAALVFNDPKSGRAVLRALEANQSITRACIYQEDGSVFAKYNRDPGDSEVFPTPQGNGRALLAERLRVFQQI